MVEKKSFLNRNEIMVKVVNIYLKYRFIYKKHPDAVDCLKLVFSGKHYQVNESFCEIFCLQTSVSSLLPDSHLQFKWDFSLVNKKTCLPKMFKIYNK